MSNVRNYTTKQILDKVKSLSSFVHIPSGVWLVAIRSNENEPNAFDDKIYQFRGEKFIQVTTCTCDPGSTGLIDWKKYQRDGIAVVKSEEWYYDLWQYGMHKGKTPALRQVNKIKYYRDNNGNSKAESIGKLYNGIIGINFHSVTYVNSPEARKKIKGVKVGTWSLGCIVADKVSEYDIMLNRMLEGKISFCLIDEFEP